MISEGIIKMAINDIEYAKESHAAWAKRFSNPIIEKKYVKTGEWDTAKEHLNWVKKYNRVLRILKKIK